MISNDIKKYIVNPALGLLPFLVLFVLFLITNDMGYSLAISLGVTILLFFILMYITHNSKGELMFVVSFVPLAITLILWLLSHDIVGDDVFYIILVEMFTVCALVITRLTKVYLNMYYLKKDKVDENTVVNEFFDFAAFCQHCLTLHIFVLLICKHLSEDQPFLRDYDTFIYGYIPITSMLMLIVYETWRIKRISQKLTEEVWLPIVNEMGEVKGKIAHSVSVEMKNTLLHPVVRVALVCNGKIYLQERKPSFGIEPFLLDHPFEKHILFGHDIEHAVTNCIKQTVGKDLSHQFLLKYTFENESTNRLIFLYVSRIKSEQEEGLLKKLTGKFWTPKQIEADFGDTSKFGECFQLEYEYLKNTVLIPDNMFGNSHLK